MPSQGSFGIFQALLNRSFVLCCAFKTFDVRITGSILSVIQVFLQLISFLFLPLMTFEMVVLKLNPVLLPTLLLRV